MQCGGNIYKTRSELYIMDSDKLETAQKLWRWNINGWGYSKNGVNGPYEMAATMDGSIVANMIKTGVLSADRIHGGTLILGGNNNYSGVFSLQDEFARELIRMDNEGIKLSNGARLIGGNGVLSYFQYIGKSTDKEFLGFMVDGMDEQYKKSKLIFEVYIPSNFVIQEAKIFLEHAPIKWESGISGAQWYGYCRYLHLYKLTNKNYIRNTTVHSEYVDIIDDNNLLDVTGAFGVNGFTANAASDSYHDIQQVVSSDIKNYITTGATTFVVQTAENAPPFVQDFINQPGFERTGQVKGFLNILGYMQ